jgi:hypothetical protein
MATKYFQSGIDKFQLPTDNAEYSSGDSEADINRADFKTLSKQDRNEHLKELWRMTYLKSVGASNIIRVFRKLHNRVINYGAIRNINKNKIDIQQKLLEKKPRYILLPDNKFKRGWNVIMILLLAYVATFVPFNICFNLDFTGELSTMDIVDAIVDILFAVDIVINFLSTYEDPATQIPVIDIKKIASNYITGWFLIDIIAVFPTQIIEDIVTGDQSQNGHQIKLVRLARLPRLYRLIRILRMLKMIRIFRKTQQFKEYISSFNISVGMIRMLNVLGLQFFMVHLMACFWFLAATFEDNLYDTWVGAKGLVDESSLY